MPSDVHYTIAVYEISKEDGTTPLVLRIPDLEKCPLRKRTVYRIIEEHLNEHPGSLQLQSTYSAHVWRVSHRQQHRLRRGLHFGLIEQWNPSGQSSGSYKLTPM